MVVSFTRVLKAAFQNFWRNIWLSIATTAIMSMTLLIVLLLYFANIFGLEVIRNVEQKVDLSVTFASDISDEAIITLSKNVNSRSDVEAVNIISSDEALEIFIERNKDKPFIEESLNELTDNPLSASMFIVATDPKFYGQIAQDLGADKYANLIDEIHFEDSKVVIEKLISVIATIKNAGLIITIVFMVLVILIMFNTVRLAIYSFREEIDIMNLVGASRWFIRGPFVMESIMVGLIAVVISSVIAYPFLRTVTPELQRFFFASHANAEAFNIYQYAVDNWVVVIGLQALVAVTLAVVSSLTAIQRYLKA